MNILAFKKQRNYRALLIRENKKQYYASTNVNLITDNKSIWRIVKQNFSNEIVTTNRVVLKDGGTIISDREKVADTFKKVFMNIESTLKIDKNKRFLVEKKDVLDPFVKAIKKYSVNLNITKIKQKMDNNIFSKCHL